MPYDIYPTSFTPKPPIEPLTKYLAIVVYKCFINSIESEDKSLDFQVIYFEDNSIDNIVARIHSIPDQEYYNSDGELVVWKFDKILTIDDVEDFKDGQEAAGFIAGIEELSNFRANR